MNASFERAEALRILNEIDTEAFRIAESNVRPGHVAYMSKPDIARSATRIVDYCATLRHYLNTGQVCYVSASMED